MFLRKKWTPFRLFLPVHKKKILPIFQSVISSFFFADSLSIKNNDLLSQVNDERNQSVKGSAANLDNILVCLLNELSHMIVGLNTSSMDLISDSSLGKLILNLIQNHNY